jgi:hypothetical protein
VYQHAPNSQVEISNRSEFGTHDWDAFKRWLQTTAQTGCTGKRNWSGCLGHHLTDTARYEVDGFAGLLTCSSRARLSSLMSCINFAGSISVATSVAISLHGREAFSGASDPTILESYDQHRIGGARQNAPFSVSISEP